MERENHSMVAILLGSNVGDRSEMLDYARKSLQSIGWNIPMASPVYESPPWGFEAEQSFYNQVIILDGVHATPEDILRHLLSIERAAGRIRREGTGYASRTLDMDILYIDDLVLNSPALTVPHPRIAERRFALQPLVDCIPDFVHPVLGKSQRQLLKICPDPSILHRLNHGVV